MKHKNNKSQEPIARGHKLANCPDCGQFYPLYIPSGHSCVLYLRQLLDEKVDKRIL